MIGKQKIEASCVSVSVLPAGDRTVAAARLKDCGDKTARSILWLYKRLLAARKASPALRLGSLTLLDAPDGIVAWERRHGDDVRRVLVSMGDADVDVTDLAAGMVLELASDAPGGEGEPVTVLRADQAVVLQPNSRR